MSATLVIMAAGLGSRYGGIKQMEGVGPQGEILMEYAIHDALKAGFDDVVVILRPDIVDDFRDRFGKKLEQRVDLRYAVQDYSSIPAFYDIPAGRSKPFGTVHAVLCARDQIRGPFAVLNADDYYGADAFVKMRAALDELKSADEACMVAYKLKNTVSEFGDVTRGVCTTADGRLTGITETGGIRPDAQGVIRCPQGELDGDGIVSMNFWGFLPGALDDMAAYFDAFLRALPADNLKAECLVPTYVGDRIAEGRMSVAVLTTEASWFGMTYQADREDTANHLRQLHAEGAYPAALFA